MTRRALLCIAALAAFATSPALAGSRNLGLGGTVIAVPDPSLVGRDNPAVLGIVWARGVRLSLFDADVALGNGSFSLSDYQTYNGAVLTEEDEQEILSKVGPGGLEFGGAVSGHGPTLAVSGFALGARGVGSGGGAIPRDVLELIFNGNAIGETVDLNQTNGGGWAGVEVSGSTGFSLGDRFLTGETTVGIKARYIKGLYHAGVRNAQGAIVTQADSLFGGGTVELVTSTGGTGYALDLGALHHRDSWNLGVRLEGLLSSMTWTEETEVRRYEATAGIGDPFASGTTTDDLVSTSDSTYVVDEYGMRLPLRLGAGVSHERGEWLFAGDVEHTPLGLTAGEDPWRISVGTERMWFGRVLRTRAGAMLGGVGQRALTGGLSVVTGPWRLDLDAGTFGTMNPFSPKGARFALGTAFVIG